MIRDHEVATQALLCYKEPGPIIDSFRALKPPIPYDIKNQRGASKDPTGFLDARLVVVACSDTPALTVQALLPHHRVQARREHPDFHRLNKNYF